LSIRLRGIDALERIDRDAEEEQRQVIDVLAAYLRKNAPWPPGGHQAGEMQQAEKAAPPSREIPASFPDIKAALALIKRHSPTYLRDEENGLDLSRTDLRGADLSGANLVGANLYTSHLEGANLDGANLEKVHLGKAHAEIASLEGANLREANLRETFLETANLRNACLKGADLEAANLFGAHLEGADLQGANLRNAQGLKFEKLFAVKTLRGATGLDPQIESQLREKSPNLL
jgi:hypothetical protein